MNPELDAALCRDFPLLCRDRNASMQDSCFHFGFTCGDGWEPLIRRLCEKLEPMVQAQIDAGESPAHFAQVKEKFWTLRIYMDNTTEEMGELVKEAEKEASRTCEACSALGENKGSGVMCEGCETRCREENKRLWQLYKKNK